MRTLILKNDEPFDRAAEFFNPAQLSDKAVETAFETEWLQVRAQLVGILDSFFSDQAEGDSGDFVVQEWPSKSGKSGTGTRSIEMTFMDDHFLNPQLLSRIISVLKQSKEAYRITIFRDVPTDVYGCMMFLYSDHAEVACNHGPLLNRILSLISEI